MIAKGTFQITMTADPPYDPGDGVPLARAIFDKKFAGPLEGSSHVTMLSARTPVADSAGYVAIERITAVLDGRRGSFVVVHTGIMKRGERSLTITVVPDSGTGQLVGISGSMDIQIIDGQHHYTLDYTF
jgi:hypothetical protein